MKLWSLAAAVTMMFVLPMGGAAAETLKGTFSGVVYSGVDTSDTFGLGAGASLVGQTVTGTFTFDPSAFGSVVDNSTNHSVNAFGGPVFGLPVMTDPAVLVDTINGHSVTFVGDGASSLFVFQKTPAFILGATHDTTAFGIAVSDPSNTVGGIVDFAKFDSTSTIISPSLALSSLDFGGINGSALPNSALFGGQIFPSIFFSVDSLSLSPVPEPATWLVLVLGIGGLGVVVRHARGRAAQR